MPTWWAAFVLQKDREVQLRIKVPQGMPLVRMKAAPVKTDGERLGNEFMNGVFFSAQLEEGPC